MEHASIFYVHLKGSKRIGFCLLRIRVEVGGQLNCLQTEDLRLED